MQLIPDWFNAPSPLLLRDGNCGLLSIWAILRYFGKRTTTDRLMEATRYTKKHGVFGIGAANAFAKHGLSVTYFSDQDPNPHRIEAQLLKNADQLNVVRRQGIGLRPLLKKINRFHLALVLYDKPSGDAHFSPLLGLKDGSLYLPYENEMTYSINDFTKVWKTPEILRQAVLVSVMNKRPS